MISWSIKSFDELNKNELYDLLKLRSEVFVVEQNCVYQDIDDKDIKGTHFFGQDGSDLIAYLRVMEVGVLYPNHMSIGRVVVKQTHRNKKLGNEILANAIDFCRKKFPKTPIKISAQTHLKSFYNQLGFEFKGEAYLEDGIPHCAMYLEE
jgi:ElaA protein|tara:strand:- start:1373 stop:1822 length:450 start_codon:yes stop_codon:yes gene_type:complete